MTFNVRGPWDRGRNAWENRRSMITRLVAEEAPILFGTQEADEERLDEIIAALPQYDRVGVGREDGARQGEQCAILYEREYFDLLESETFWLSETPDVPNSFSWDTACTRICTYCKLDLRHFRPIHIFNCHLDHVSEEARAKGMELILSRVRRDEPSILMGDLNAGEDSAPVQMAKSVLLDTFRAISDEVDVNTFTEFDPSRLAGEKIDYIFCTEHFSVLDAAIVRTLYEGQPPSDHFPVTATLRLDI
jgi:endonuclease/exonuclease/phosphatase family metal-dependent hydrolase